MASTVVHVLSFEGCPHAALARRVAEEAASAYGGRVHLVEVDLLDPELPAAFRGYPSPTVLVDMSEVIPGERSASGLTCRAAGAPSTDAVRLAIAAAIGGT